MKRITLLFFMSLFSFVGYAQLAPECFEDPDFEMVPAASGTATDWLTLDNGIGLANTWMVQVHAEGTLPSFEGLAGTHAAYIQRETVAVGETAEDYLVTPEFNLPVGAQLKFQSRLTAAGDQGGLYRVMILDADDPDADPSDPLSYTLIEEWTELEINPSQLLYNEITVTFPVEYENTNVRVAFVMEGNFDDRWLVDCVSVTETCLDPANLVAGEIGLDSAVLTWDNPAGATTWEIEIVPGGGAPTGYGIIYEDTDTVPDYTATGTATGNPLVQAPFEPDTEYKYWVRAICDDGGQSEWVGALFFQTVGLGDTCNAPIVIGDLSSPYSTTDDTANYADEYNGSPGGCGTSTWDSYLNGNDVVYELTPGFTGTISIDFMDNGSYSGIWVYEECEDIGNNCFEGGPGGWEGNPVYLEFEVTEGEDYYIVISTFAAPQTTPYTMIIQQVFCDKPENLSATNIGMTTAELLWDNPSGATSWEVEVGPAGDPIPSGDGEYTVTTNTGWDVPAGVLGASTAYQYYVRADCGDGTFSAWAGPYYFNTAICEIDEQCAYTFNMWAQWDGTWNGHTMNVIQNGIVVAVLEGPTTWGMGTVSQTVNLCTGYPFELFWNANTNWAGDVAVSITNNFDQEFFVKNWGEGSPGTSLYTLEELDCDNIMCLPPAGLYTENPTMSTIDLGWEGPATGDWEYYIVEAGEPAPTDATAGTATTSNPTLGAGPLDEATNYEFYVRMVCEDAATDFSTWAGPYAFSTSICDDDKCTWTFVMTDSFGDGWNGNTMTVMQGGVPVGTFGAEFTTGNGPIEATLEVCNGFPVELHWNAGGSWAAEVGVTVMNSFDQNLYTKPAGTGSQGTMLWEGEVDCDTPLCLEPTGLYTENETMTTVDLGWDGQPTGAWEYYIVEAGEPAPDDATPGTPTTTNPTTDVPLDAPATNYEFYVRMVCEDAATDFSGWTGPFAFNSEVCNPDDKCVYNFVMTSAMGWGGGNNTFTISQGGVPVTTIGGDWWGTEMSYEVALCPDSELVVTWNAEGWDINDKGLIIYTPFAEDIYVMEPGSETPGSVIFQESISCDPPPCPKPQNLDVTDIGLTEVTLNWDEMGTATQWTVWVYELGAEDPTPDTPGIIVTGEPDPSLMSIVYGDEEGEELTPGTPYVFYVMAMCGGDNGNSTVSGPFTFVTAIANDECDGAVEVPVNPTVDCDEILGGTFTGATSSGVQGSCMWQAPPADVWYSFVAESTTHAVSLLNISSNIWPYIAVYEGTECGDLTEVACNFSQNQVLNDLVPGNTYYVQVYLDWVNDPAALSTFNICVRTPMPPIAVNDTEYTIEELVSEVLLGSDCAQVSNVTWLSGSDFGQSNSIGYFEQNGSDFPFEYGVVLGTSGITEAPGPNPGTPTFDDQFAWPDDEDLTALIAPGGWTAQSYNATVLEFDFVPLANEITFDFLFASHEYGTFQCGYSDAFAFLLTHPDGTVENLAVIPGTDTPVSVVTIRDNEWNAGCESVNPEYFDQYNPNDPLASAISYNGQTIVMEASADVLQGEQYHIKLVIQDYLDGGVNSAVFLGGGSFDIGDVDLGLDFTIENGNAICNGGVAELNTNLEEDVYDFVWYYDEDPNDDIPKVEIEGETGPILVVEQNADGSGSGTYSVDAIYEGTTCAREGDVIVEFYEDIEVVAGIPEDLEICDSDGFATFDLSQNTPLILSGEDMDVPENYTVTYHISQDDAENNEGALDLMHTNVTAGGETIYVRIAHVAGCLGYTSFQVTVTESNAEIAITDDFSLCEGTSGTITATVTNTGGDFTYSWTHDGAPMADTTGSIEVSESGVYEVTIDEGGCTKSESVTVTVVPMPIADAPSDVDACEQYVLPALTSGNYYTGQGGTGDMLEAGTAITSTQIIYVFAESGTTPNCTDENSFEVRITSPQFSLGGPYVACDAENLTISVSGANFELGDATYEWTVNETPVAETGSSIVATEFGTYTVTVTVNGCTATQSVVATESTIVVAATVNDECNDDNIYTLEVMPETTGDVDSFNPDTASYAWTGPNGFTADTRSIVPNEIGMYSVTVTTAEGCEGTAEFEVTSTICLIQRGISPNDDGLNDNFDLSTMDVTQLSIFNRYGQEVYSRANYTNQWEGQGSNGDELPTGTYFYMIERSNGEQITGWIYVNREE